jgi:deazaflavin-dependent oxidoreductase (nitroreductase family)
MTNQPGPIVRRLLRAPGLLYDWHAGWLLGHRFLRLTHLGRRSGRRYRTMLEVVGTGQAPGEVVVVAGLGRSADWFRNLQAGRGVEVAIGRRRFRPRHRVLGPREAVAVLADYERRNRWVAPLVRRVLSWLVGWRYDGSDGARRRLAGQLPLVALRPDTPEPVGPTYPRDSGAGLSGVATRERSGLGSAPAGGRSSQSTQLVPVAAR